MIYLLTGENNFEMARFIESVKDKFDGQIDSVDSSLGSLDLTSLILGGSLFSSKRLVILKQLSETDNWLKLPEILGRIHQDDIVLVIEPKPDKRTKTYKDIAEIATVKHFDKFEQKDRNEVRKWLVDYAKIYNLVLDTKMADMIIDRAGLDQWALSNALERLELAGGASAENIAEQIDLSPSENIFQLLETALRGETKQLKSMIEVLRTTEDVYKTMGLISSQVFLLLAVKNAGAGQNVAKDFDAHPYVVSRMKSLAGTMPKSKLRQLVLSLKKADELIKTAPIDPWIVLEQALSKVAFS